MTTTVPITLSNELNKDTDTINFYTKKKKTTLIVENKFQFTHLIVVINSHQLKLELAPHPFKQLNFDLTPYIKNGQNKVTFVLPYTDSSKKSIRVYIELNAEDKKMNIKGALNE